MALWITISAVGFILATATTAALRYGIRDIWDAILVLVIFIALFATFGDELTLAAEATLLSLGIVVPEATRSRVLLASVAVAVSAATILSCALVLVIRRARRPERD